MLAGMKLHVDPTAQLTVRLPHGLVMDTKQAAMEDGTTLQLVVARALRQWLKRRIEKQGGREMDR